METVWQRMDLEGRQLASDSERRGREGLSEVSGHRWQPRETEFHAVDVGKQTRQVKKP